MQVVPPVATEGFFKQNKRLAKLINVIYFSGKLPKCVLKTPVLLSSKYFLKAKADEVNANSFQGISSSVNNADSYYFPYIFYLINQIIKNRINN